MSEIEKMMQNAGVEKQEQGYCDWDSDCPYDIDNDCGKTCPYWVEEEPDYPQFTEKKQLELIKWLARKGLIQINYSSHQCYQFNSFRVGGDYKTDISEALSSHCNNLWQYLTEQERTEIAEILK